MDKMYDLVTITKREYGEEFLEYLYEHGIHSIRTVLCEGTAQKKVLNMLGIEKTEKVMLSAVTSAGMAQKLLHGLLRDMQIDVPGNGIAFTIPLRGVADTASLHCLTRGQIMEQDGGKEMEENQFSLVVVIAQKGHTELVMDAARSANAGGGTIVHGKGVGEKSREHFFGMSIASEQELIYIVAKRRDEQNIMRAIMEKAGTGQDRVAAVFSLPVNQVVGLRSLMDE